MSLVMYHEILYTIMRELAVPFRVLSGLLKNLFPLPLPAPKKSKRACCRCGAPTPHRQHALDSSGVGGLPPSMATLVFLLFFSCMVSLHFSRSLVQTIKA